MRGWEPRCQGLVPESDTLGNRITQLRERAGLTPRAFAELTGLSVVQVRRFAFGQKSTRADEPSIRTIAAKFGVNPTWLGAGSACPARMWPDWWKP